MKRSAIVGIAFATLLVAAIPAAAAQRTVLAEMFGASWCGYCPNAKMALWNLQEDDLVVLYFHVNDSFATSETMNRASYYMVGGIPEVDFDSVEEVIGAGSPESAYSAYEPILLDRLAEETPITISASGLIHDPAGPDSSWVTAVFKAVDTVPEGDLTAQFIIYENISETYPYTVRDMLPPTTVTSLSAPGDSVTMTRRFVANPAWDHTELRVAVFIEDRSQPLILNARLMPDPYHNAFTYTDRLASEIPLSGEAQYVSVLENTGVMLDTITVDIAHDLLPDGVGAWDWIAHFEDSSGAPHYTAWDCVLEPGEAETFAVHVQDVVGTATGLAVTAFSATSNGDPEIVSTETYATFVNTRSILIVDDDGGQSYETYLEDAIADTGQFAYTWDASARGRPTLDLLAPYWAVLWTTGNGSATYLGGACENNMAAYLDGGGNLLLASMDFLSSRVNTLAFRTDYLHIDSWSGDTGGFSTSGVVHDPITDGLTLSLTTGPFATNYSDSFTRSAPADTIFSTPVGAKGLRVEEDGHKAVFLAFPFENVSVTDPAPNNQKNLLGRILAWFELPLGVEEGGARRLALEQNYPNPFNPVTRLAFTVPEAGGRVTLRVHDVSGRVVATLVDESMPAGPGVAVWDGSDASGHRLASGVYFAKLEVGGESAVRKITLLK
jgi:thiol-disulfide isomerase/thioredoxin